MTDLHLFDSVLDGVVVIDTDRNIQYSNESFSIIADRPSHRILSKSFDQFISMEADVWSAIEKLYKTPGPTPYIETRITNKNNQTFRVQISANRVERDLGFWVLILFRDVTLEETLQNKYKGELKQKEDFIVKLDRKVFELEFILEILSLTIQQGENEFVQDLVFEKIIQKLPIDFVMLLHSDTDVCTFQDLTLSSSYYNLVINNEKLRKTFSIIKEYEPSKELSVIAQENSSLVQIINGYIVVMCITQTKNLTWSVFCFAFAQNKEETAYQNLKLLSAVTQQTAVLLENQSLYFRSITDEKTRLYNNRYFRHRFDQEIRRSYRHNKSFALLVLDIDHFKKFNDTHGHLIGDKVLVKVAEAIKTTCRTTDITARFGGEEFVALCIETDTEGALIVAERIRQKVESSILTIQTGENLKVTASLGIGLYPDNGSTFDEVMEAADTALYKAKHKGRNRVEIAPVVKK